MHSIRYLLLLACTAIVSACGGGSGGGAGGSSVSSGYPGIPVVCDTATQRAWLRDYMNAEYFWYANQAAPDDTASTMASYFNSMLYKPLDRYSYSQSTSSFTQLFSEGKRTGYGYSLMQPSAGVLRVSMTEPLSPVAAAGLKRGDNIISIDGFAPSAILTGALAAVSTAGVSRSFVAYNPTDGTRSFSVLSAEYSLSPVHTSTVLTAAGGRKVGYLAFNQFINTAQSGLVTAVDSFRTAAVQDLILDLRYNGGGSTAVAGQLALLLGGDDLKGQVFARYQYNNKLSAYNFNQNFSNMPYTTPLASITRLFVISSGNTASASEMVINNLKPYRSVSTIGSTTYGKPFAFQPIDACGTTYNAVNLLIANSLGNGDYASGITPTCAVADDLSRPLGDPLEARTAAALQLLTTGSCPAATFSPKSALAQANTAKSAIKFEANTTVLGEDARALPQLPGAWLTAK